MYTYWFVNYIAKTENDMIEGDTRLRATIQFIPIREIKKLLANKFDTSPDNVVIRFFCPISKETFDGYVKSNKTPSLKLVE